MVNRSTTTPIAMCRTRAVVDTSIVAELLRGGVMDQRLAESRFDGQTLLHAPDLLGL